MYEAPVRNAVFRWVSESIQSIDFGTKLFSAVQLHARADCIYVLWLYLFFFGMPFLRESARLKMRWTENNKIIYDRSILYESWSSEEQKQKQKSRRTSSSLIETSREQEQIIIVEIISPKPPPTITPDTTTGVKLNKTDSYQSWFSCRQLQNVPSSFLQCCSLQSDQRHHQSCFTWTHSFQRRTIIVVVIIVTTGRNHHRRHHDHHPCSYNCHGHSHSSSSSRNESNNGHRKR